MNARFWLQGEEATTVWLVLGPFTMNSVYGNESGNPTNLLPKA